MSLWSDLSRFAGNLTGGFIGESDAERRRKQQQAQRVAAPAPSRTAPRPPLRTTASYQTPTQQRAARVFSGINQQRGLSPAAQQAQTGVQQKVQQGLRVQADPIDQQIDEPRKQLLERSFNEGKSFEHISDQTGLGVEEVRRYADKTRPGYGVKPLTPGNALEAAAQFGKDMVGAAGQIVTKPVTTLLPTNDRENAYQAARGALQRGEITPQKFYETTGQLAKDVIGKKVVVDDKGITRVVDKNALEFGQEFTDAGYNAASLLPIATGAKAATAGAKLLPTMVREGATWGTVDTANDAVQGRLSPEQIASNYLLNATMAGGGHAVTKGVEKILNPLTGRVESAAPNLVPEGTKASLGDAKANHITPDEMKDIVATHRRRFGDDKVSLEPGEKGTLGAYTYHDDMIKLAEGKANPDTFHHESIHKAVGQFLDDAEIEQLYTDIIKVRGGKHALTQQYRKGGYTGASWRTAAEEELANTFNDFLRDNQANLVRRGGEVITDDLWFWAHQKGLPKPVVEIFWKLYQAIKTHFGPNSGQLEAQGRIKDFYTKVDRGDFNGAPRRNEKYKQPVSAATRLRNTVGDAVMAAGRSPLSPSVVHDAGLRLKYGNDLVNSLDKKQLESPLKPGEDARARFNAPKDLGDKTPPQFDNRPETLLQRATAAGMAPDTAVKLMKERGANAFRIMLDESNDLQGATNPDALATHALKQVKDGSKVIGGTATKNDMPMSVEPKPDVEAELEKFYGKGGDQEFMSSVIKKYESQKNGKNTVLDLMNAEEKARYNQIIAPKPTLQDPLASLRTAETPPSPQMKQDRLEVATQALERVTQDKAWTQDAKYIRLGTDGDARRLAQVLDRRLNVLKVVQQDDVVIGMDKNQVVHYVDKATGEELAAHHVDDLAEKVAAYAKLKQLSERRPGLDAPAKDYNPVQPDGLPAERLMKQPSTDVAPAAPEAPQAPVETPTVKDTTPAKQTAWTKSQSPKDAPRTLKAALPSEKASVETVSQAFPQYQQYVSDIVGTLRKELDARGINEADFVDAMMNERHAGTPMPKDLKRLYKDNLQPLLEYMRRNSRTKLKDGRKTGEVYFHERASGSPDDTVEIYGSVVEAIDTSFGASQANKGKLYEKGTYEKSLGAYQNYADQWFIDKYKPQMLAEKSGKPVEYHQAEKELGDKLVHNIKAVTDDSLNAEPVDIVAEHQKLGELAGEPQTVIKDKLAAVDDLLTDDASKLKAVELDDPKTPGEKVTLYKRSGIERYDYAQNRSHQQYAELFPEGDPAFSKEEMHQRLLVSLADANVSEETLNQAVRGTMARIDRVLIDRDLAIQQFGADSNEVRFRNSAVEKALRTLNKRVGREEFSHFLQTHQVADKRLKGVLNYQADRMLTEDRLSRSTADKAVDIINKHVTWGALGMNVNSMLLNLTEIKRIYSDFGVKSTVKAIYTAFKDGRSYLEYYGVEPTHFENVGEYGKHIAGDSDEALKKSLGDRYDDVMGLSMAGFKLSEEFKDKVFLAAYHAKAEKMTLEQRGGKSVDDYVMDRFQREAIKYGKSGTIGANKNPLFRLFFQFSQYWVKDATITMRKARGAWGGNKDDALYLVRLGIANAGLYAVLAPTMGSSLAMIFNSQPPTGGPMVDFLHDLYDAYQEQERNQAAAQAAGEEGTAPSLTSSAVRALKKDTALAIPGGNQLINKTGVQALLPEDNPIEQFYQDGYLQDRERGFNLNGKGKERFAIDQTSKTELVKGLVNGSYNQKNAHEYFGKTDPRASLPIIGKNWKNTPGIPVWDQVHKDIAAAKTIQEKQAIFNQFKDARLEDAKVEQDFLKTASKADIEQYYRLNGKQRVEGQSKLEKLASSIGLGKEAKLLDEFWNGPQRAYYKTEYGADGRKVSDLISPEKWKIQWDNPGVYKKEKEDALLKNKRDGAPLDPIYQLGDSAKLKELLQLRSAATGDMTEREEILKATAPWYVQFKANEKKYYEDSKAFYDKLDLGDGKENQRVLDYAAQSYLVAQPPLVAEYFKVLDASGKAEANKLFKVHGDALGAAFDEYSKARLAQINAKRKIEGHDPISLEVFQNKTFGFTGNADGTDVASSGSGSGWKSYVKGGRSGRSGGGSRNEPNTGVNDTITSFGNQSAGMTDVKAKKLSLKDPRKAVKTTKRANRQSPIRIKL